MDENETTRTFVQKIFDKLGSLIEIHEKFPIDKGHIVLLLFILISIGVLAQII